jgi:hypothetical protein
MRAWLIVILRSAMQCVMSPHCLFTAFFWGASLVWKVKRVLLMACSMIPTTKSATEEEKAQHRVEEPPLLVYAL